MKKFGVLVMSIVFGSGMLFAADTAVKVSEETKNKGEAKKIENRERIREHREAKEMKKEMKQERKEKRELKGDTKSAK